MTVRSKRGSLPHGLWTADRRVLDPSPLSWLNSCTRVPNFSVSSTNPHRVQITSIICTILSCHSHKCFNQPASYAQNGSRRSAESGPFKRPACGSFPSSSQESQSTRAFLDGRHYCQEVKHTSIILGLIGIILPLDKALPDGSSGSARDDLQEIEFGSKMLNAAGGLGF